MIPLTAIEAKNLTKSFAKDRVAVSSLDLDIAPGTVFGLVGRNGAGKSTALRLLMGLLQPDHGHARIMGQSLWTADRAHRSRIGYVPQHQQLPGRMSLDDLGRYVGTFYEDWNQQELLKLCRRWGLNAKVPVGRMSGGEQRKSALLIAIHAMPQVLILDEPAAGLDSVARRELLDLLIHLIQLRPETTMLISTHHIGDLARIAQQVGMMDRGRLTRNAQLDELQERVKKVQVVFSGDAPPRQFKMPGMIRQETTGPVLTAICEMESEHLLNEIGKQLNARVQCFPLSLEEIFLELFENRDWHSHADEDAMPEKEMLGGNYENDHE